MELKEAMKTALHFEKRAHHAYSEAATHTSNSLLKKTFSYLAAQELRHMQILKEYVDSSNIDFEGLGDDAKHVKNFFDETVGQFLEKAAICKEDLHAYEAGLHLEKTSYDFYKERHEKSNDEEVKKFFKFLMEQENAHFQLLEKSYHFLKDPENFHADNEQWLFEG